ncbi:hypothetical protein Acr_21g0002270 [Actinidia rufa]|uniref:Uncharacterized protein n=1 Tax=Actinidia rufa TaxID=165716 RepID=A0A7J0GG00_9ERIC|nr:hypothetical protein Acr_21g0002270 [Actinidia rufa]
MKPESFGACSKEGEGVVGAMGMVPMDSQSDEELNGDGHEWIRWRFPMFSKLELLACVGFSILVMVSVLGDPVVQANTLVVVGDDSVVAGGMAEDVVATREEGEGKRVWGPPEVGGEVWGGEGFFEGGRP